MLTTTRWSCPRCGREFAAANQWHSCVTASVDEHFERRPPELRAAFDRIAAALLAHDGVRLEPVKTIIHFAARSTFAAVTPRADRLRVSFLLDRRVESPRVINVEPLSARRIGHSVEVRGEADVDEELLSWLAEACRLRA